MQPATPLVKVKKVCSSLHFCALLFLTVITCASSQKDSKRLKAHDGSLMASAAALQVIIWDEANMQSTPCLSDRAARACILALHSYVSYSSCGSPVRKLRTI